MGPCAQPPRQKHSVAMLGLGLAQAPGATSRMTSASTTTADSSHRRFVSGPGPSLSSWEPLTGSADVSLLLRGEAGVNSCASSPAQQPDGHVPTSLFHSFPVCRGVPPPPRWAHSMVCVGSTLFIYGGIGVSVQGDLWTLDTAAMSWRALSPTCAGPKDQPVKMLGHAAAAAAGRTGNKMFVFGGQQGRTLLRKLYCLDLDQMAWRRISNDSLPSARAGHAMVTAGSDIYLFGGHGKKLLNDLYKLNPDTGEFTAVQAAGRLPQPRHGMSLTYDGKDSLVCFGGTHAHGVDAALNVFSLSRREWSQPQQQGPVPQARTNHTAVLLSPHLILVWGGCTREAMFLGDATILDTRTFTWHRPHTLNAGPAPRYHHACCAVNGRAYLYGGINGASKTFDGIVVLDTKFSSDISHIAEELHALAALSTSSAPPTAAAATASSLARPLSTCSVASTTSVGSAAATIAGADPSMSLDLMKAQLMDLLYKRNMEEMHAQASMKAETTEALLAKERETLEALRRENMQLRMMYGEADSSATAAKEAAKAAEAKAAKAVAALSEARASHAAATARLSELEADADVSKRRHQALVKELGAIASRFAKLQQQQMLRTTKRKPLNHNSEASRERERERERASTPEPYLNPDLFASCPVTMIAEAEAAAGSSAAGHSRAAGPEGSSGNVNGSRRRACPSHTVSGPLALWQSALDSEQLAGGGESGMSSARTSMLSVDRGPSLETCSVGGAAAGRRRACLNRLSTRTEGCSPRMSDMNGGSIPRVEQSADMLLLGPIDDILSRMSEVEQHKQELEEQLAVMREQLEACCESRRAAEAQARRLRADAKALAPLRLPELAVLEQELEDALKATREVALQRRMEEVQRRAACEQQCCSLCLERPRGLVFNCGHQTCTDCSDKMASSECPFCRTPITARIRLFDT